MKKSLVALAVLAASGAAMAQSSVTLYGIMDTLVGYQTIENTGNKAVASVSNTVMGNGSVNGSRWGMKGSEDLGGGLKAIFDLQSGIYSDTGAAAQGGLLFGRQAMVGFQGGFGKAIAGRVIMPFYDNEGMNDVMLNASLSAQSNVMRTANNWGRTAGNFIGESTALGPFETNKLGGYTLRGNNAIRYDTPNLSGFVGAVAYSMDEKVAGSVAGLVSPNVAVTSASLVYVGGPVSGVLAYQNEKPYQPDGVGTGYGYVGTTATDRSYVRLSGQYDFGAIIAKAGFGRVDHTNYIDAAKTNEYQLGLDYKASDVMTLTGGVASSKDDSFGATPEVKRNAFVLGGKYVMSKRTFLYGGYESGKQEKAGSPDAKESVFALGVQHRF